MNTSTVVLGFIFSYMIVVLFPDHIETVIRMVFIILLLIIIARGFLTIFSKPKQEEK